MHRTLNTANEKQENEVGNYTLVFLIYFLDWNLKSLYKNNSMQTSRG